MRTSERSTFPKGSRHSAVTVCLLLVMCLVFLTACGKDKKRRYSCECEYRRNINKYRGTNNRKCN